MQERKGLSSLVFTSMEDGKDRGIKQGKGSGKKSFGELDGYIRGRLRSFEAKRRTLKILVFGIHPAEFAKMGLVSLSSMLDDTISCKGIRQMKAVYQKSVRTV
jgi:hypothetical protein